MEFIIDNNVVISWNFEDRMNPYTEGILDIIQTGIAYVPAIWPLELTNALAVSERRGKSTTKKNNRFLLDIMELSIEIGDPIRGDLKSILTLAREHTISTYDASYLDLAIRLNFPIASLDAGLLIAAAQCDVPILLIDRLPPNIKDKIYQHVPSIFATKKIKIRNK